MIAGHYEQVVDRESAYERIKGSAAENQAADASAPQSQSAPQASGGGIMDMLGKVLLGSTGPRGGQHPGILDAVAKSAARSIGSQVGREIFRGVLGSILGGRGRR